LNIFETVALEAPTFQLIALGALAALFVASFLLNIWFLRRMRVLDARQTRLMQRIKERTDRRDLAAVAVAAVVLMREVKQAERQDIEGQIEGLVQHWAGIEEMADEISRKLDEVVSMGGRR
jgi:hypothetical protein